MQAFCTIITANHYPFAQTLSASLRRFDPGAELHVLIIDDHSISPGNGLVIVPKVEIERSELFRKIESRYGQGHPDLFRWALKPALMAYLLDKGFSKLIYVDPDTCFVGKFDFLFSLLDSYQVLLTPHWADPDIINNPDSVYSILKGGLFNAGFIAASQEGKKAIRFWGELCHHYMGKDRDRGTNDDQKYLDLLPVQFAGVYIVRHRGCNLASWNIQTSRREMINGRLMINGEYDPVFIHFTKDTVTNILNLNDALLRPLLDEYANFLKKNGVDLFASGDVPGSGKFNGPLYKVKHRARIRTRLKRFLHRLAEKL